MSNAVTRSTIRDMVRQRLDMVGSTFIGDSEFDGWIDRSTRKVFDLLVDAIGEDYYTTKTTFSTSANTSDYALNTICGSNNFYKLRGIYLVNGTNRLGMNKACLDEIVRYSANNPTYTGWATTKDPTDIVYCIFGDTLRFAPTPTAVCTCEIWYVPPFVGFANDSATFDAVNGWDDYIVADVCIKGGEKEERDVSEFAQEKAEILQRIAKLRENRDRHQVYKVRDVQATGRWV